MIGMPILVPPESPLPEPPAEELTETIKVWLTKTTKTTLVDVAEDAGTTTSAYVRRLISEHLRGL